MNDDTTMALISALRELARNVDEDVPVEYRTRHLTHALSYAYELAEACEGRGRAIPEPLNP